MKGTLTTAEDFENTLHSLLADSLSENEAIQTVAYLIELSKGSIPDGVDLCTICGNMPMTTNCNNAGCDV